jgi:N-acetylneuraminic acid mutarotase
MKTLKQIVRLLAMAVVGIGLFAVLFTQLSDLVKAMPLTYPPTPATTESSLISATTANPWETRAAMPTERATAASAQVDGVVYVIGGWTYTSTAVVEAYNPTTDSWTTKASMNVPRTNLAAVALDNKIYAIGGWSLITNTTAVEIYDPLTNLWTPGTPLPVGNNGLKAAVADGKIFTFGGWDGDTTNSVMMYDPQTELWTSRAPMPTARVHAAVATVDGKIYVIGGENGPELDVVEIYDPIADSWSVGAPMPGPRSGIAAVVIHNRIYVVSGANERYDPATDSWTAMAPVPTQRWGLTAEAVDGKLYATGGWFDGAVVGVNEMYVAPTPGMVNVPGDYQTSLGCSDNWLPDCANTAMTEIGNNQWSSGPFLLPAGSYECKVALDGSWAENYGLGGVPDGSNIPFSLDRDGLVSFVWDEETKLLTIFQHSAFLPAVLK